MSLPRSFRVTGISVVQYTAYVTTGVSILYRFTEIISNLPKFEEVTSRDFDHIF